MFKGKKNLRMVEFIGGSKCGHFMSTASPRERFNAVHRGICEVYILEQCGEKYVHLSTINASEMLK